MEDEKEKRLFKRKKKKSACCDTKIVPRAQVEMESDKEAGDRREQDD